jgi:hypothetical protein
MPVVIARFPDQPTVRDVGFEEIGELGDHDCGTNEARGTNE